MARSLVQSQCTSFQLFEYPSCYLAFFTQYICDMFLFIWEQWFAHLEMMTCRDEVVPVPSETVANSGF